MKNTHTLFLYGFLVSSFLTFVFVRDVRAQEQAFGTRETREYVIGIGDSLNIETGEKVYSRRVNVLSDGTITMPDIGDFRAAGLRKSSFEKKLETLLGKYLKNPRVTVTVSPSKEIRFRLKGAITQESSAPRETMLSQILRSISPTLAQIRPQPKFDAITVSGSDQEEFLVNGIELLEGRTSDIRLEWGDTIIIPRGDEPTPVPTESDQTMQPATPFQPSGSNQTAIMSEEDLDHLVEQFSGQEDILQQLLSPSLTQEGMFELDLATLSEDERLQLGEELLAALQGYIVQPQAPPSIVPPDMTLVGIQVNLAYDPPLEAFFALWDTENPTAPPTIKGFKERKNIKTGEEEGEDHTQLYSIQVEEKQVLLKKGEQFAPLPLSNPDLTQAKLTGILNQGRIKRAFFMDLNTSQHKKASTRRGFEEGQNIEGDVELVTIADKWVLLKDGQRFQFVSLRDAALRPTEPEASPQSQSQAHAPLPPVSGMVEHLLDVANADPTQMAQLVENRMKAMNTLSKMLFATPLFE